MKNCPCLMIEVIKKNNRFEFIFPQGSSYQDCYDALCEATQEIIRMSKERQEVKNVSKK